MSRHATRSSSRAAAIPTAVYLPAPDPVLLWAVLALAGLGLVMIYSASAVTARQATGDPFFFVKRQALAALFGGIGMLGALRMGYRKLQPLAYPLLILSLLGLLLVLIPGIGTVAGGARRWIRLPGASFQPAELAKLAFVVYLAYSLSKKKEKVRVFSIGFLPHCFVGLALMALCLLEPDFGSAVAIGLLLFAMLFAAGARITWLLGSVMAAIPFATLAVASSPYRMKRILAFLDPWAHRHDIGYQVAESLMSVGSGGIWGLGLGDGRQKLFFLPEAHTDFIFSIIGEELGLLGSAAVIGLYAVIIWRGLRTAFNASDAFGAYLALGLTSLIGFGACVNLGVAMGALPTKGLTLPFVSYGGTSLVLSMYAAGVLLSISQSRGGFLRPQLRTGMTNPRMANPFAGLDGMSDLLAEQAPQSRGAGMKLLIAGGGTGGHLFPGIALAEELTTSSKQHQVVFVGTPRGIEAREVPRAGFPLELIDVTGLKGKGLFKFLAGLARLPLALFRSLGILRREKPDVVFGVGGYASGPLLFAAWLKGIPTAIQEQNATPGVTNRILSRFALLIFTAFPEAAHVFPRRKVRQLGNPIRRQLLDNFLKPHAGDQSHFALLVIGGSQGAHALNLAVPEAIARLPDPLRKRLKVVFQTGPRDRESVAARFKEIDVDSEVLDFIVDMSAAYSSASLVVSRAEASTLAELAVCQRAAILVPFPYATGDHQTLNARSLVQVGAAVLIPESELTPDRLAAEIAKIAEDPKRLAEMERASARLGRPEAAREIAEVLGQLARGEREPGQTAIPTRPEE